MIFEDAHWVDPTSLEALGRTVDRLRMLGVLLIEHIDRSSSAMMAGPTAAVTVL